MNRALAKEVVNGWFENVIEQRAPQLGVPGQMEIDLMVDVAGHERFSKHGGPAAKARSRSPAKAGSNKEE